MLVSIPPKMSISGFMGHLKGKSSLMIFQKFDNMNVVNNRQGKSLVRMLTQLINNSGISICMVGTLESSIFFEPAMQLARRSLGLQY